MLTFEQIKDLVELVAQRGLQGLEIERSGFRLKIDGYTPVAAVAPAPAVQPTLASAPEAAGTAPAQAAAGPARGAQAAPSAEQGGVHPAANHVLNSPIVGTFYRSPSPDAGPFVEVGARVKKGQVLCIIEAMKLMNEIESDVDGTVVEIYPQNAQAVEFGEALFALRTS